jgi:hypothetical protein
VTEAAVRAEEERVARLWLATGQELARRSAHDVKNALNGVAVNLEVVRSRLARPGAAAEAAAGFAATAVEQFERVTEYAEALIALARPARQPTDPAALLGDLRPFFELAPAGEGASAPAGLSPGTYFSRCDAQASRLALAAALLAAADRGGPIGCRTEADDRGGVRVRVSTRGGAPELAPELADAIADAGIRLDRDTDALTLTFAPLAG